MSQFSSSSTPSALFRAVCAVMVSGLAISVVAQERVQTEQDAYTRFELESPQTGQFRVIHDVAVTTPGARIYEVTFWPGTVPTPPSVTDLMTGNALSAELRVIKGMSSQTALAAIQLARAVPENGQARIRINYTATNTRMFSASDSILTFSWPAESPRGTVVLPAGYELLSSNIPAQVISEDDGRIAVSYLHQLPEASTLTVTARAGIPTGEAATPAPLTNARSWEGPAQRSTERARLSERATQDRDIVYFLQSPETNAFSLYHDYTETRPGTDKYLNVVRTGARVSDPSADILDTGEVLKHEVLKGEAITAAGLSVGNVTADTEVVVLHFPPVKPGHSVRLRISETYTTPESYRLDRNDLVFERSLGRARNSVVLPPGWYLTGSSIPAIIRETADGIRLDFVNGRPEGIDVLIKGRKRQ